MDKTTKPKRRRLRRFLLITAVVFLVVLGWAGYWIVWAFTAEPTISVDYSQKLIEISRAAQPEGENAWPLLAQLDGMLRDVKREVDAMDFPPRYDNDGNPWPELTWYALTEPGFFPDQIEPERIALRLLEGRGMFDMLDQARAMPCVVYADGDNSVANPSDVWEQTHMALLATQLALRGRMRIAAERGDYDAFEIEFARMLFVSRAMSFCPTEFSFIRAVAAWSVAFGELSATIVERDIPARNCRGLRDAIDSYGGFAPLTLRQQFQRMQVLDQVQRSFTDDGDGDGRCLLFGMRRVFEGEAASGNRPSRWENLMTFRLPSRAETTAELNKVMAEWERVSEAELTGEKKFDALDAIGDKLPGEHSYLLAWAQSLDKAHGAEMASIAMLRGAIINLAIEEFQEINGHPPKTLEELIPNILNDIPLDPLTGQSFGYRLLEEQDEFGRSHLLYAKGFGDVDNGGTPEAHKSSAVKIFSDRYRGDEFDYVLNQPRASD